MKTKITITKRKDIITYLKRYYTGKGLIMQMIRENDNLDCSSSDFDYVIRDHIYYIVILKRLKRMMYDREFSLKKYITIDKRTFKKLSVLLPMERKENSEELTVEDFIIAITTRKDVIDEILVDTEINLKNK